MELIDIGINLTHASFDPDRERVIERAAAVGVVSMVVTGATLESSRAAIALADAYPGRLAATAGVHPHHALQLDARALETLRAVVTSPAVVAVGECGLDYFRDLSPHAQQRAAFVAQLELAAAVKKPVFLHQREAHADFLAILREHRPQLTAAVAHCFTGGGTELEDYLGLGLHIGITGWICDERRGAGLKPLMRLIPAERLMVETDAPYLLPRDLPATQQFKSAPRRNEAAFLPHIASVIAAARGETLAAFGASSTAVARQFFGLKSSQ